MIRGQVCPACQRDDWGWRPIAGQFKPIPYCRPCEMIALGIKLASWHPAKVLPR